jgi:prefoldin subunit 5
MSGDEKTQQIGQVVTEYQAAKVELAHLNQKLKTIGDVYTEVGRALTSAYSSTGEFKIENGHFRFSYGRHGNQNLAASLLNEEALVAVIVERDAFEKKVQSLRAQMKSLGITNLE